jgi:hypothetical protein
LIKKLILLCSVFISCLSFAEETPQNTQDSKTKELFNRGQQFIAGGTDALVNQAESYAYGADGNTITNGLTCFTNGGRKMFDKSVSVFVICIS